MQELDRYDPVTDRYNQTRCGICWGNYSDEPVAIKKVRLVCDHVFHKDCIRDTMAGCPLCKILIPGRVVIHSRSEIENEVDRLFFNLYTMDPNFLKLMDINLNPFECQKSLVELIEGFEGRPFVQVPIINPYEVIRTLNRDILILLNGTEDNVQALFARHYQVLVRYIIDYLNQETPVQGSSSDEFLEIDDLRKDIKSHFVPLRSPLVPMRVQQYAIHLENNLLSDPQLIEEIANRKIKFIDSSRQDLLSIPFDDRINYLRKFQLNQLKILVESKDPLLAFESKEAMIMNINYAALRKIFMQGLLMGISFIAFLYFRHNNSI